MNTSYRLIISLLVVLAVLFGVYMYMHQEVAPPLSSSGNTTTPPPAPIATATFVCNEGKSIEAAFYAGESKPSPSPNMPPTPGGSVALILKSGATTTATTTLAQTISADGGRYADAKETMVFWSKGRGATITENNLQTYTGCVEVVPDPGMLSQVYTNGTEGVSLRYPAGYTLDDTYHYQALGPGKDILGAKFTIPASVATGTNLSKDSYVSIEVIPQAKECTAALFLDPAQAKPKSLTDGDMTYSFASSTDAGAGNRYEESVYALPGTNPCIAVRYFIHYGAIENYPEGMVKAFDHKALTDQFDQIRRTLVVE